MDHKMAHRARWQGGEFRGITRELAIRIANTAFCQVNYFRADHIRKLGENCLLLIVRWHLHRTILTVTGSSRPSSRSSHDQGQGRSKVVPNRVRVEDERILNASVSQILHVPVRKRSVHNLAVAHALHFSPSSVQFRSEHPRAQLLDDYQCREFRSLVKLGGVILLQVNAPC
jgi:hypothetical protein